MLLSQPRPEGGPAAAKLRPRLALLAAVLAGLLTSCNFGARAPVSSLMFGAYVPYGVWRGMAPVHAAEREVGGYFDVVHWYMNWDHGWDPALVDAVLADGRLPLISWQPHRQPVARIAVGAYDGYLRSWARGVGRAAGPVYLRPFPEMNGDWVTWNGDPEALVEAWRRMVGIFREEGADNVRWVWAPNITDEPRDRRNRMEAYFPGEDYVDVLGLDGYNFGTSREGTVWRSFREIFTRPYDRITRLGSLPVWITEMASAEKGGDKGAWILDMLSSPSFRRLEAVVWFSENKLADWRLDSSPGSLEAFRIGFAAAPRAER